MGAGTSEENGAESLLESPSEQRQSEEFPASVPTEWVSGQLLSRAAPLCPGQTPVVNRFGEFPGNHTELRFMTLNYNDFWDRIGFSKDKFVLPAGLSVS